MYGYEMGQNVHVCLNLSPVYSDDELLHRHANVSTTKNVRVSRPNEKMCCRDGDAESFRGQAPSKNQPTTILRNL